MDWITESIAIGNYLDARNLELLQANGIRSILALDGQPQGAAPEQTGLKAHEWFNLVDGAGNDPRVAKLAVNTLADLVASSPPVLVHCHAGRSRSVVIVAGYLMRALSLTPEQAIEFIADKREINLTDGIEDILYFLDPRT